MTNFTDLVLQKAIHIGHFRISGERMKFTRNGFKRGEILAMGDVVYFMFVDGIMYKIGKAGGKDGFESRSNQYSQGRGPNGDPTNRRIMDVMEDIRAEDIQVYALSIPRRILTETCPLTGETFETEVTLHKAYESRYTTMYLDEDAANSLPFCKQLK